MLNNVCLVGRLTRDPECSYVSSGIPLAKFTIAVDRIFKDAQTGEKGTDFVPVVCWRKTAEFVNQYVGKGRLVSLNGRLQVRSWVTNDGEKRFMTEVVADEVQALDRPRDDKRSDPRPVEDEPAEETGNMDPFEDE